MHLCKRRQAWQTSLSVTKRARASFSLGDIAILALSDRIGVVVRDGLSLLAGVEAEHALGVAPEDLAVQAHRLIVVGGLELGLAHLRDGAATCF